MEVIIKGNPKEIADLVFAVQSQHECITLESPLEIMESAFDSTICDIDEE